MDALARAGARSAGHSGGLAYPACRPPRAASTPLNKKSRRLLAGSPGAASTRAPSSGERFSAQTATPGGTVSAEGSLPDGWGLSPWAAGPPKAGSLDAGSPDARPRTTPASLGAGGRRRRAAAAAAAPAAEAPHGEPETAAPGQRPHSTSAALVTELLSFNPKLQVYACGASRRMASTGRASLAAPTPDVLGAFLTELSPTPTPNPFGNSTWPHPSASSTPPATARASAASCASKAGAGTQTPASARAASVPKRHKEVPSYSMVQLVSLNGPMASLPSSRDAIRQLGHSNLRIHVGEADAKERGTFLPTPPALARTRTKLTEDAIWADSKEPRSKAQRGALQNTFKARMQRSAALRAMSHQQPDLMRDALRSASVGNEEDVSVPGKKLSKRELLQMQRHMDMSEDVQAVYRIFKYHDASDTGCIRLDEVHLVLGELGVRPNDHEEYTCLNEVAAGQQATVPGLLTFQEFLQLLKASNSELRQRRWQSCLRLFDSAGGAANGALNRVQALKVLAESLGLAPQNEQEKLMADRIFYQLAKVDSKGLGLAQFEELVQQVRTAFHINRAEDTLAIAKNIGLGPSMIAEFRYDLKKFWRVFDSYATSKARGAQSRRVVDAALMRAFLLEVGVLGYELAFQPFVMNLMPTKDCAFQEVVTIIHFTRKESLSSLSEDLLEKFQEYAVTKGGSGERCVLRPDIYKILHEFGMMPRSREEQHAFETVIGRFDWDCSGNFEFEEFQVFYSHLLEQHRFGIREKERKVARDLKFDDRKTNMLRQWYLSLCPDFEGTVAQSDIAPILPALHRELTGLAASTNFPVMSQTLRAKPKKRVGFEDFAYFVSQGLSEGEQATLSPEELHAFAAQAQAFPQPSQDREDEREDEWSDISEMQVLEMPTHLQDLEQEEIDRPRRASYFERGVTQVSSATLTLLESQYKNWIWQEVKLQRQRFDWMALKQFESRAGQEAAELFVRDEAAWPELREGFAECLGAELGEAKMAAMLPETIQLGVPIFMLPFVDCAAPLLTEQLWDALKMKVLAVEPRSLQDEVELSPREDTRISEGDRVWFGFESGNFSRLPLERYLGSASFETMHWSWLPVFRLRTPPELYGMTLGGCDFQREYGALVCGMEQSGRVDLFPADSVEITPSTCCLLMYLLSPVKFFMRMGVMSWDSTATHINKVERALRHVSTVDNMARTTAERRTANVQLSTRAGASAGEHSH